jgi:hypothetical protein
VGDPAGSNATADLALRVTGTHKPLHRDKVEIPSGGNRIYQNKSINLLPALKEHKDIHHKKGYAIIFM